MQNIPNYKLITPDDIDRLYKNYINDYQRIINKILKLDLLKLSYNNLFQPLVDFNNNNIEMSYLSLRSFHPNTDLIEKINSVIVELSNFSQNNFIKKEIYLIFKSYYENQYEVEKDLLTYEQRVYVKQRMMGFESAGLKLSDDKFKKYKELQIKLNDDELAFDTNINQYSKTFYFTVSELDGLPEKYIQDRLENNKVKVTLDYPDYYPIMEYCINRNIRKNLYTEFNKRAMNNNGELADKIFSMRKELTKLLEKDNYSDYALKGTMAEDTNTVMNFLDRLKERIKPIFEKDIEILQNMANKDNIKLELWDVSYYTKMYKEIKLNINFEELKKYFPVQRTINNVFKIYQQLLAYTFTDISELNPNKLWSPEIKLYQVTDTYSNLIKGFFYLDLYPRENKYGHAAAFPIIEKSAKSNPIVAMVCNFNNDYLTFDEFETFFHEFGHAMHFVSSDSTISDLSSFNVESDFVETPSQMFEEWCYSDKILKIISPEITDDIINKIKLNRSLFQGYGYYRQLSFCYIDMYIHSKNYNNNSLEIYKKFTYDLLKLKVPENTNPIASFDHLINGYDAGYYGYLWSLMYAKDMYSAFKNKELSQVIGLRFRNYVLTDSCIRPAYDCIYDFLGREPNDEAFIESLQ